MKKLLTFSLTLLLISCTNEPKPTPKIENDLKSPLYFNVATVEFIMAVHPTFEDQYRKRRPYPELATALQDWGQQTFVNRGSKGTLILTVERADIKESAMPRKQKAFTYVESEKYEGTLSVRLEIKDEHGVTRESMVTTASHMISVLENISLAKREKKIAELAHNLVNEMDERMRQNIQEHLSAYLVYTSPLHY
jgi:hypothetical protein